MFELVFVGGFFVGVVSTLGVLALIVLRWSKSKAKKTSAHSLDTNRLWNKG